MSETDEAFKRYCAEFGLCNRVVFDTVWKMATDEVLIDVVNSLNEAVKDAINAAWGVVLTASPTERQFMRELQRDTKSLLKLRKQLVRLEDRLKEVERIKYGDETNKSEVSE